MDVHSDTAFAPFIDAPAADSSVLLRDIAYERIKDAIRLSRLQPGQPLSETRLSRELGISRTPVREALQLLAQEGLVQVIPGRAVSVAAPSVQEVMDAIHVRLLLEPEVTRLAAKQHLTGKTAKPLGRAKRLGGGRGGAGSRSLVARRQRLS